MPQPIDVGSILGGRYKVTGRILASAENDVILDGLDQVLNRPVSILVSAVSNSANLTQSAREVAIGSRISNVSILDLGVQDDATYLIAARTSPTDLLDLVIPTDPAEEVYQEPFFTDTLGTEIFGKARDAAPAGGAYVYEDNSPMTPATPLPKVTRAAVPLPPQPNTPPHTAPPTAAVTPAPSPAAVVVPPVATPAPAEEKVTLWDDGDYGFINEDHDSWQDNAAAAPAGTFPAHLRGEDTEHAQDDLLEEDDDGNAPRSSGRWLTGAIVAVLLIGGLIFAVQHIGGLSNGSTNQAGTTTTSAPTPQPSQAPSSGAPAEPKPVLPVIKNLTDITTYAPVVQNFSEAYYPRLKDAIDGNKATYWPTVEFSNADFANLTEGIDLVVELADESTISSVTINQLGGSGGQFNILTNSKPELQDATKIGSGSFSAPDFTLTAAPGVKAKYVIINFTQLPKLQPFVTYPYGLKISEISVK
ncbi:ABC transporter substrate-binding protein [Arthrobacter sp. LAPM80]|uniref:ABC transporter substrate-binding protein n=1 Tax=Arthrobacter sp. LAPM80 TaxID=3141788 RepID=UPI00398AF560